MKNLEVIRDWLKNFAEDPDNKKQMSVHLYEQIWNEIQSIDISLETTAIKKSINI